MSKNDLQLLAMGMFLVATGIMFYLTWDGRGKEIR